MWRIEIQQAGTVVENACAASPTCLLPAFLLPTRHIPLPFLSSSGLRAGMAWHATPSQWDAMTLDAHSLQHGTLCLLTGQTPPSVLQLNTYFKQLVPVACLPSHTCCAHGCCLIFCSTWPPHLAAAFCRQLARRLPAPPGVVAYRQAWARLPSATVTHSWHRLPFLEEKMSGMAKQALRMAHLSARAWAAGAAWAAAPCY